MEGLLSTGPAPSSSYQNVSLLIYLNFKVEVSVTLGASFIPCSANFPDLKAPNFQCHRSKIVYMYSYKFVPQDQEMSNKENMGCGHKE